MTGRKTIRIFAAILLFTCCGIQAAGAEPVAPLLEMTDQGLKIVKSQGKTLADVEKEVPAKANIGIPVYPAAYYATHVEGSRNGSRPMLPSVSLVSEDSPETIKTWYRNNLGGWKYDETFALFHDGMGQADMESLMSIKTQTVSIMAEDEPGFDLMFYHADHIKSRIIIRYKPRD